MRVPENSRVVKQALDNNHKLADLGVPVFGGRLDAAGNPDRLDRRWKAWEQTQPGSRSHRAIDAWRPGEALCAVMGQVLDGLDYDPRNDPSGKSPEVLEAALGEDGPEVYMRVDTPSGGKHLYIASLGIAKTSGFLPGFDLQAGRPDGTGRGFLFLPPTVRPSKVDGKRRAYRIRAELGHLNGDPGSEALRGYVKARTAGLNRTGAGGREEADELRQACLDAEGGEQRTALLRYTRKLGDQGYAPDDIVRLCRSLKLENFDPDHPWRIADFRNLLDAPGERMPDAVPGELEGIEGPRVRGLVRPVSDLPDEVVTWLWDGYLAEGEITMLDGEKGQGKTFVEMDIAARGSRRRAMPGQPEPICPAFNTVVFTYEGQKAIKARLAAAGADMGRVFVPDLGEKPQKRGDKDDHSDPLALPGGAVMIGRMIREADARLAIFDPIADFLDETVSTNNDASVRRALKPLGVKLSSLGCAGLALRHMNKDKKQDAKFRGTGSSAFQNRGRFHMITGELPDSYSGEAMFGLAMVDANDIKENSGTLTYSIVDSEFSLDGKGRFVGRVKWMGFEDISANSLTHGDQKSRGPKATAQPGIEQVLAEMFDAQDIWSVPEVMARLEEEGVSTDRGTIKKVREKLGVESIPVYKPGGGVSHWSWTTEPQKYGPKRGRRG